MLRLSQFELRVASGPTAGRVVASPIMQIVEPHSVRMVAVPGTAQVFISRCHPAGEWGAGFWRTFSLVQMMSFLGVTFGEGVAPAVVTPPGSFLSAAATYIRSTPSVRVDQETLLQARPWQLAIRLVFAVFPDGHTPRFRNVRRFRYQLCNPMGIQRFR